MHLGKTTKVRLHKLVKETLKNQKNFDYTNPEIQRNIAEYGVLVEGKLIKNRLEWVYFHQHIQIDWPKRDHGNFDDVKILQETGEYLILYKPPGIVVQAGSGHQQDNLVEWLVKNVPSQKKFNTESYPTRGLVHRLDKLTQGVLLVAKDEQSLAFFQKQFRERQVQKKYFALLEGELTHDYHIKNYQSRNKANPVKNKFFWSKQQALAYDEKSRYAESYFRPHYICRELSQTIAEVEIKTGRMHQIRLQAQAINHAVVGDPKYSKIQADIPKTAIQTADKFDTGLFKKKTSIIHNINKREFLELKLSLFGQTDFCLLSNKLKLKTPSGENLEVKYY